MTVPKFDHFCAIDWSGAAGPRQKGIAVAICSRGDQAPGLIHRDIAWSRAEVLTFLGSDLPANTLVGLDLGIALPFEDCEAYFPGWDHSPADARALWALVDRVCADEPNLEVSNIVDHPELSRYFRRHGGREGDLFLTSNAQDKRGRLRVTEYAQQGQGCKPYSNFNLVGAAQVGKSSLTGMRMLHQLNRALPVWPIDPLPTSGSVITEIYTGLAAIEAGRSPNKTKIRDYAQLNEALAVIDSRPIQLTGQLDDHSSDAILTSAWLRKVAPEPARWAPKRMSLKNAATEGWTFGAF